MAYTPNNWKDGDVITAEKMNKLEQAVNQASNNVLAIETESGSGVLNVTPNDINNAFENNSRIIMKWEEGFMEASLCSMEHEPDGYYLIIGSVSFQGFEIAEFYASSETDYFVAHLDPADDNPSV